MTLSPIGIVVVALGLWVLGCIAFRTIVWLACSWVNPPDPSRLPKVRDIRLRLRLRQPTEGDGP